MVKTNLTNQMSSSSNVTESNKNNIENLFTRFAVFYGHIWRSQFKNEGFLEFAKKEWGEGLRKFNDELLDQAILACRDYFDMPPSLAQMIGICRDLEKRNTFFIGTQIHQPASKELVEENIEQCKSYLL